MKKIISVITVLLVLVLNTGCGGTAAQSNTGTQTPPAVSAGISETSAASTEAPTSTALPETTLSPGTTLSPVTEAPAPETTQPPAPGEESKTDSGRLCWYRGKLSGTEVLLYDMLKQAAQNGDAAVYNVPQDISRPRIAEIMNYVLADCPELFYLTGGGNVFYHITADGREATDSFELVYCRSKTEYEPMQAQLAEKVAEIISGIGAGASEYEKVLYIYEYIIDNTEYDSKTYADSTLDSSNSDAYNAYGAIVNGLAVCSGYAKAFGCLCNLAGIDSVFVTGEAYNGGAHGWNAVKIDGDWYFIDATWGDPLIDAVKTESANNKSYNYFCFTFEEMLKLYNPDEQELLPAADSVRYNYYVYNGMYSEYYDSAAVTQILKKEIAEGAVILSVKFGDSRSVLDAQDELIGKGMVFSVLDDADPERKLIDRKSVYYASAAQMNIFNIYIKYFE